MTQWTESGLFYWKRRRSFCYWTLLLRFVSLLQTGRRSGRRTPTRTSFPKPERERARRVRCRHRAWIPWSTPPPAPTWPSSAMYWLCTHTYQVGQQAPPNDQFWCLSKNETAQDYLSKINANDSVTFLTHLWSCPASFPAYTLENREIPNTSLWGPPATVQVTHGLDPYTLFGLLLIWREALAILCDRCSSLCTFYLYRCVYKCLEIDTCSSKLLHIFAPAERTIFLPCRINAGHSCAQMTDLEEIRQTPNIGHMAPVKCLTCFM